MSDIGYFLLKFYYWFYDLIFNKLILEIKWSGGKFFRVYFSKRYLENYFFIDDYSKFLVRVLWVVEESNFFIIIRFWKVFRICLNLENLLFF